MDFIHLPAASPPPCPFRGCWIVFGYPGYPLGFPWAPFRLPWAPLGFPLDPFEAPLGAAEAPPGSFLGSLGHFLGSPWTPLGPMFFGFFLEGAFFKFWLAFCFEKHVFYEGVFQKLAFRSRVRPKVRKLAAPRGHFSEPRSIKKTVKTV